MNDITICVLDKDLQYLKAFMSIIAADHVGYTLRAKTVCSGDCGDSVDVCVRFEPCAGGSEETCDKVIQPVCGKYAGVSAILCEARTFLLDKKMGYSGETASALPASEKWIQRDTLCSGSLICIYALEGGAGASVTAIGVAREFSRYRGDRVLYLSLEDVEDKGLYSANLGAMQASEILYRYFRIINTGADTDALDRLFRTSIKSDEYGLYRVAPDEGLNSMAALSTGDFLSLLTGIISSLELTRVVLDFGTRLRFLSLIDDFTEDDEALFVRIRKQGSDEKNCIKEPKSIEAIFSRYDIALHKPGTESEICLTGTFGYEIKDLCDRVSGLPLNEASQR